MKKSDLAKKVCIEKDLRTSGVNTGADSHCGPVCMCFRHF